jgi:uncharacterized membrane protein
MLGSGGPGLVTRAVRSRRVSASREGIDMRSRRSIVSVICLVAVALSAIGASAASASPAWEFNGTELASTETVFGVALSSSLLVPGATTTCAHMVLTMQIFNVAGKGKGEVTELSMFECTAGPNCTVNSIEDKKLPWPVHVVTVGAKDYVVIEKIHIGIVYSGALCSLAGSPVVIKGTAGGLFENSTSTLTFSKATFTATGTALKVGTNNVVWDGIFPMEALGAHSGEALEIF